MLKIINGSRAFLLTPLLTPATHHDCCEAPRISSPDCIADDLLPCWSSEGSFLVSLHLSPFALCADGNLRNPAALLILMIHRPTHFAFDIDLLPHLQLSMQMISSPYSLNPHMIIETPVDSVSLAVSIHSDDHH